MEGIQITLSPTFGCVVFDIIFMWGILTWMMLNVLRARKKYDVQYPALYSDKSQMFNCIQRAHQNTLELFPQWVIFLILGGLQHPYVASISGFFFAITRITYALGYYTGDPNKRVWGSIGGLGLLVNIGCTVSFALHLVGYL